ncbi:putative YkwD family protein [Geomicrobium halophilum]|uniref:Putative YkwD family protein n=1 Tax=Geomicrobium halophilum TaxID=549000 RepID=A0A841PR62_9BACL|nr:CAP domain-containing protein [Geomicrobium halophilum]MBB6451259.1 putative YkwD family protein [Geomicrobium halophilum]
MKKYLVALSAFLLVPAGAMAQDEEDKYLEGEDTSNPLFNVQETDGNWSFETNDLESFFQKLEDRFNIEISYPEFDQAEDEEGSESEANNDGSAEEGHEHEEQQQEEGQPESEMNGASTDSDQNNDSNSEGDSSFTEEVIELTNEERTSHGLEPLEAHDELSEVATVKSEDMRDSDYFSHDSPNYGSPFDMMNEFGVDYRGAGENIAAGQQTPEQVVDGWMDSDGHRANILNDDFTHIGVGYAEGGSYGQYWTQMFLTE